MSALSELNEVLLEVLDRLERTSAHTATAIPLLEQARATMRATKPDDEGWYPAGLDIALSQAQRTADLIALASQAVSAYAERL